MAISVTFSLDESTMQKLRAISRYGKNSEKIRELISREWERIFGDSNSSRAESIPTETIPMEIQA